jgi:hypothetical protein
LEGNVSLNLRRVSFTIISTLLLPFVVSNAVPLITIFCEKQLSEISEKRIVSIFIKGSDKITA